MSLLHILIVLVIVGIVLWFVNKFIPLPNFIKTVLNVVVVIAVIWWLLTVFGIVSSGALHHLKLK